MARCFHDASRASESQRSSAISIDRLLCDEEVCKNFRILQSAPGDRANGPRSMAHSEVKHREHVQA